MGRYGLDWSKGLKNFTDEDWNIVLTETTKIIDAKQNMKEVALSLNDRGIVYRKKKKHIDNNVPFFVPWYTLC
jgi:hypothetical protein